MAVCKKILTGLILGILCQGIAHLAQVQSIDQESFLYNKNILAEVAPGALTKDGALSASKKEGRDITPTAEYNVDETGNGVNLLEEELSPGNTAHQDIRSQMMYFRAWRFHVVPSLIFIQRYEHEYCNKAFLQKMDVSFVLILAFLNDILKTRGTSDNISEGIGEFIEAITLSFDPSSRSGSPSSVSSRSRLIGNRSSIDSGAQGFNTELTFASGSHLSLGNLYYRYTQPAEESRASRDTKSGYSKAMMNFAECAFLAAENRTSTGMRRTAQLEVPQRIKREGGNFMLVQGKGVFLSFPANPMISLGRLYERRGICKDRTCVPLVDVLPYNARTSISSDPDTTHYRSLPQAIEEGDLISTNRAGARENPALKVPSIRQNRWIVRDRGLQL